MAKGHRRRTKEHRAAHRHREGAEREVQRRKEREERPSVETRVDRDSEYIEFIAMAVQTPRRRSKSCDAAGACFDGDPNR